MNQQSFMKSFYGIRGLVKDENKGFVISGKLNIQGDIQI